MGAVAPTHPTDETLRSYGSGELDDASVQLLTAHLESCAHCQRRIAERSSDSSLGGQRDDAAPPSMSEADRSQFVVSSTDREPEQGRSADLSPDAPPAELSNHPDYQIIRELGRGGMGVVYLVNNRLMGRHEAIKLVSQHLSERPAVLERFMREIRSVAKLRHPNIVAAYSATRIGKSIVYAMEYVDGLDLATLVKNEGPLPVIHACYFIHQVAMALQHAHEQGIVHRDIKPGNLILTRSQGRPVVKILDFGLNKATSDDGADYSLTRQGQMLGTPDFIAPEQVINAQSVDIRADIYSLGCTLYYLLAGGPPFRADSLYEILHAHRAIEAKPLDLSRTDLPSGLAGVVAKMMAKKPEDRFQTPAEVAYTLSPFFQKQAAVTGRRTEENAAIAAFQSLQIAEAEHIRATTRTGSGATIGAVASRFNPVQTWIAVGAGAAASLLLVTFIVMWFTPRKDATPAMPEPSPKSALAAVTPRPVPDVTAAAPIRSQSQAPEPGKTSQPRSVKPAETAAADRPTPSVTPDAVENRSESNPSESAAGLATTDHSGNAQAHDPKPSSGALAAVVPRASKATVTDVATTRFDPALLTHRPKKPGYPLDKVLAKSQSYANQIVVPSGMYHLARSETDGAGGKRKFLVTERKIQSTRDSSLGMSSSPSTELEVEPNLAGRLDQLNADEWTDKVAIVSLWFTTNGTCVLVKVELLVQYITGFKKGTVYPQGDVDYETLVVTPEKSEPGKGLDEDWEEPGRMLHFANLYKKKVLAFKKMLQTNEHAQLNGVMANLWGNMMKNAAADTAAQQQMQRALLGR